MAGLIFDTDLDPAKALAAAVRAARSVGLELHFLTERQFRAKRGNLAMSWLLPPVTPYCNFLVTVLERDNIRELVLERNTPWWTGYFGVRGVEGLFDKFAAATEDAIGDAGGKVLQCRLL